MSNRPLRVLYVNHVGLLSGAEKSLLRLLEGLAGGGVQPLLAAPPGPLSDAAVALGVTCLPLEELRPRRTGNPLKLLSLAWRVRRLGLYLRHLVRRERVDLVHANSLVAGLCATAAPLGVPVLWHARDLRAPAGLVARVARRAEGVVAISETVRQWLLQTVPALPEPYLVYNALSRADRQIHRPRARQREDWELGPHTPVLGCVGQLVPWKRQDLFLRAGAAVVARRPETRLVIVGADLFAEHADYRRQLEALAEELGLGEHLVWAGACEDMPSCLAALDALVHPAEREPLGRVVMEAMAVGVPPVAFAQAGPAELIEDGASGLLAPPGDAAALGAAALRVLQEPELALRLHDGALARAAAFEARAQGAALTAIYRDLAGRG